MLCLYEMIIEFEPEIYVQIDDCYSVVLILLHYIKIIENLEIWNGTNYWFVGFDICYHCFVCGMAD